MRLAFQEVLTAGVDGLERADRSKAQLEEMFAQGLGNGSDMLELPDVVLKGIVGGIWCAVSMRLAEGGARLDPGYAEMLVEWMLCYRSPVAKALSSLPSREFAPTAAGGALAAHLGQPPTGPVTHSGGDARRSVLAAAMRVVGTEGYDELSVARIIGEAGISLDEFSALYASADECFLASLDFFSAQALARALRESKGAPNWEAAACMGMRALLCHIAEDAACARAAFVEVFAVGPKGVECRAALIRSFASFLKRSAPSGRQLPPLIAEAIVGAVWTVVHHHVLHGRAATLPSISALASYLILAPILGAEEAAKAIRFGLLGHEPDQV